MLQLEECAVQLWNWAVTRNVGTTITTNQKAKGTLFLSVVDNKLKVVIRLIIKKTQWQLFVYYVQTNCAPEP